MAESAIECPYCQVELTLSEADERYTCEHCQHDLSGPAQLIYARGRDLFLQAQQIGSTISARKRRAARDPEETRLLHCFQQACSALQEALKLELADSQRDYGIEMMVEITQNFARREMVSTLEARYWTALLLELNARREREGIQGKIVGPTHRGIAGLPWQLRWRLRRRQLSRALTRLDQQIRRLEEYICFADPPRARYWAR